MGCIIAECAVMMVDCRMIDHIRHIERSEQESEDVRVFLVLAAKGLEKTIGTQSLSCSLSTCGRKLTRFWDGPGSSACVLRDESCLETF